MSTAIFTLFEKHYHFGVGALVNSLVRCGFRGRVFVGYRGERPPWTSSLQKVSEKSYTVGSIEVDFFKVTTEMHLGYFKPFAAMQLFEEHSDIDTLFYADPDIVVLANWDFFESWVARGIALVTDSNFSMVVPGHPWRITWERLLSETSTTIFNRDGNASYVNGGFFGVTRPQSELLNIWCNLTVYADSRFCDISKYEMDKRSRAIVSDQDILNASLLAWRGPQVIIGPEAMGFTGQYFIMSHAIGSPKPWNQRFVLESLKGNQPSYASQLWLNNCFSPIPVISPVLANRIRFDLGAAKLISRFWSR